MNVVKLMDIFKDPKNGITKLLNETCFVNNYNACFTKTDYSGFFAVSAGTGAASWSIPLWLWIGIICHVNLN